MKKALFVLTTVLLFATDAMAQQFLIDKISLPDSDGDIGFYADIDVKEGEKILYDLRTTTSQKARAELSASEVKSLISSLEKSMQYYTKWSKLAHDIGFRLLSKKIPTIFADQNIYFTQEGKWYYESGVDMCAMFFVDAEGECHFILESDYMTSKELAAVSSSVGLSYAGSLLHGVHAIGSSESQITIGRYCAGSYLSFKSVDEIKEFIKKLQDAVDWKKQNITDGKVLK